MEIHRQLIERFLELASQRLRGNWVLLGGAVLPALGVGSLPTLDIDIAGPPDADQGQVLILMEIAESLGLPVEAINQAAAFFLQRMEDYQKHLIPLVSTDRCIIHRPDATLFIRMKLHRLSAKDLEDCLQMLAFAKRCGEAVETDVIRTHIDSIRAEESLTQDKLARLTKLERTIEVPLTRDLT